MISALEFYGITGFDLLDKKAPVGVDLQTGHVILKMQEITSVDDLL